ncbi:helix-turn-helix transcriptional regulator [Paenibacillus puerhi]|uniref:helix-turn-helix transcriptional regulator n=1 Tax=Paenibacillus puerhi TaxID=2692622 RepID=UPI00135A6A4B|nr:helix-turn-helix transcriptional regulator [Paenibacillus puerhi]
MKLPVTKVKLTVDSHTQCEIDREKLVRLHSLIIREVAAMSLAECVKITLECNHASEWPPLPLAPASASMEQARNARDGALVKLSERQREIAFMLCNHYSIKKIASAFYVSENTVKKHIQNIKKALEIEGSGADFIYTLKELIAPARLEEISAR